MKAIDPEKILLEVARLRATFEADPNADTAEEYAQLLVVAEGLGIVRYAYVEDELKNIEAKWGARF